MEPTTTRITLARIVSQAITLSGIPLTRIAQKTNIPYSTLYRKLNGGGDFTFAELSAIANVIDADVVTWAAEAQTATRVA